VIGGAAGNLVDRLTRGDGLLDGAVVDFIDFSFFPAFNLADSAITVGAVLALWLAARRP
jgi:signal peptidase II